MPVQEVCKQRTGELKIHHSVDLGKKGDLNMMEFYKSTGYHIA